MTDDTKSLLALASLVCQMRAAQREYFRTRSADALEDSRRLEKAVDAALQELYEQPRLFT